MDDIWSVASRSFVIITMHSKAELRQTGAKLIGLQCFHTSTMLTLVRKWHIITWDISKSMSRHVNPTVLNHPSIGLWIIRKSTGIPEAP